MFKKGYCMNIKNVFFITACGIISMISAMDQSNLDEQVIAAVQRGDIAHLQRLKDQKANFNIKDKKFRATGLHWAIGAPGLSEEKRLQVIKFLLENTPVNVDEANGLGTTPLLYAVFAQKLDLVKELLKHKADVNIPNNAGDTPIRYAGMYSDESIKQELLKAGAKKSDLNIARVVIADPEGYVADFSNHVWNRTLKF
jgi:ankyrin repeat protein